MTLVRHPGEFVREIISSTGLAQEEVARQLGVSRSALARLIACRAALSPDLALRLEAWLMFRRDWRESGIARPVRARDLLRMQSDYVLEQTPTPDYVAPVKVAR
jgi:addiction module HigA family antidote